jgi:hypothetical protein
MRRSLVGVGVLLALGVSACSSSSTGQPPGASYTLLSKPPPTATACDGPIDGQSKTCVGWGDPGQLIVVVLGSSSCPTVATSASMTGKQAVAVVMESQGGPSCTADASPTASAIGAPSGIDATQPVTVTVGKISIGLPPRSP